MEISPLGTYKYAHELHVGCGVICGSESSKKLKFILLWDEMLMNEDARGIKDHLKLNILCMWEKRLPGGQTLTNCNFPINSCKKKKDMLVVQS